MIITAKQACLKIVAQKNNRIAGEAHRILQDIYAARGITQTTAESSATRETFKAIDEICTKRRVGRYVLSLSAGSGKTTFMIAWCTIIHKKGLPYSVSIASQKVDDCLDLRKQLIEQGIPEEDIGVLYKDDTHAMHEQKKECPSTKTPEKHRFLLVAHARLEQDAQKTDYLRYNGENRSIIFWDEAFRKAKGDHYKVVDLKQDLCGFLAVWDDNTAIVNFSREDSILLKGYLRCVLKAIKDHQETRNISKVLNDAICSYSEEERKALKIALKQLKRINSKTKNMLENLIGGQNHLLLDNKIYSYRKVISDHIQQMLILDASYKLCALSKLDKSVKPLNIHIPRSYPNLTVRYAECSSGRKGTHEMLKKPKRRTDLMQRVAKHLNDVPEDQAVLFMVYKDRDGKDFQPGVERELKSLGFSLGDTITINGKHKPKYGFLTWGNQNGTNEFQHCQHLSTIGIMDMGTDNVMAQAIALTDGEYLNDDEALTVGELNNHDYAQRLYQAIFRLAIRRHEKNIPCTVTLFIQRGALKSIDHLIKALPEAVFVKDQSVFKDRETETDKSLKIILKCLDNLCESISEISTQKLREIANEQYGLTMTKGVSRRVTLELRKIVAGELCNFWSYKKDGRGLVRVSYNF